MASSFVDDTGPSIHCDYNMDHGSIFLWYETFALVDWRMMNHVRHVTKTLITGSAYEPYNYYRITILDLLGSNMATSTPGTDARTFNARDWPEGIDGKSRSNDRLSY